MANKYHNDKSFLIIKITFDKAKHICNFGYGNAIYCDSCNKTLTKNNCNKIYFIAVLGYAVCKSCCDNFIKTATHYEEDVEHEVSKYNYFARLLNLELENADRVKSMIDCPSTGK